MGHDGMLPPVLGTVLTAIVTPFDASGAVDEKAFRHLCHHLLREGSDGIVVAGTTGEASTLTDDERLDLIRITVDECSEAGTVVAGTGSNDTAHSVHLTEAAKEMGVDAVLAVTPYYNRPPAQGIVQHVSAIAEVGVPVVLYNIPGRTGVNMPPELIVELAAIPGVMALKQANPDLAEARAVLETTDLALYAGNDDMYLPVLEMGGTGVISVASHLVGDRMQKMAELVRSGDVDDARGIDDDISPLYTGLFETTNPILIKAALQMVGLIPDDTLRLPLVRATEDERQALSAVLADVGVTA